MSSDLLRMHVALAGVLFTIVMKNVLMLQAVLREQQMADEFQAAIAEAQQHQSMAAAASQQAPLQVRYLHRLLSCSSRSLVMAGVAPASFASLLHLAAQDQMVLICVTSDKSMVVGSMFSESATRECFEAKAGPHKLITKQS